LLSSDGPGSRRVNSVNATRLSKPTIRMSLDTRAANNHLFSTLGTSDHWDWAPCRQVEAWSTALIGFSAGSSQATWIRRPHRIPCGATNVRSDPYDGRRNKLGGQTSEKLTHRRSRASRSRGVVDGHDALSQPGAYIRLAQTTRSEVAFN
jgi:hypothetical protein